MPTNNRQLAFSIKSDTEMLRLGAAFAKLQAPLLVYLDGDLGAGKTTLVRGAITALLPQALVKSPTYNIVETYELGKISIYHFDLYRIFDPDELEALGLRDYLHAHSISFIEWPERGAELIGKADINIQFRIDDSRREVAISIHQPSAQAEFVKALKALSTCKSFI